MIHKIHRIAFVGDPNVNVKYNISGGIVRDNTVTFQLGSHNFTSEVSDSGAIGGSAIMAAVAANRAAGSDVKVSLVTFFGKDRFTPFFDDLLQREGIVDVYRHQNNKVPNDKTNEMLVPGGAAFYQDKVYDRDKAPRYEDMSHVPDTVYLTSVNWPWVPLYRKTIEYAQSNGITLAFSPGATQLNDLELTPQTLGEMEELHDEYRGVDLHEIKDTFFDTLRATEILFVNKRDAVRICIEAAKHHGRVDPGRAIEVPALLRALSKLGPKIVSITDERNGSYALDLDGSIYALDPYHSTDPGGAGDAYAGAFMSCRGQGESIPETMTKAAINAGAVNRPGEIQARRV